MRILWRRMGEPGCELCQLDVTRGGITFKGVTILSHGRSLGAVEYEIALDSSWQTRAARVVGFLGRRKVHLELSVGSDLSWRCNGRILASLKGCTDIDLGFSPSTNTLPIRRLGLKKGQSAEVVAAWVEYPSFHLKVLPQLYRRVNRGRIHYESANGGFKRELTVNDTGVVLKYPGLWEAVAIE